MFKRTLRALAFTASLPLIVLVSNWPTPASATDIGTQALSCTISAPAQTWTSGYLATWGISCTNIPPGVGEMIGYVQGPFGIGTSPTQGIGFMIQLSNYDTFAPTLTMDCTSTTCTNSEDGTAIVTAAKAALIANTSSFQSQSAYQFSTTGVQIYPLEAGSAYASGVPYTCNSSQLCGTAYFSDDYVTSVGFFDSVDLPVLGLGLLVIACSFASGWTLMAVQSRVRGGTA